MILADVFKNSEMARETDYSTNGADDPVVVQFAASNGVDLAAAAEMVAPFAGGIGMKKKSKIKRKKGRGSFYITV